MASGYARFAVMYMREISHRKNVRYATLVRISLLNRPRIWNGQQNTWLVLHRALVRISWRI